MAGGDRMINNTTITSLVEKYLAYRRKLGFDLKNEGKELLRFARFADTFNHNGFPTTELALKWVTNTKKSASYYWKLRLNMVRRFARYCTIFNPKTEVPPESQFDYYTYKRPKPYIYSSEEISVLIQQANILDNKMGIIDTKTFQTIIGLLACTGLRISEALRISIDDFEFDNGLLKINETKFHKSRLLPVHHTTQKVLFQYLAYRNHNYHNTKSKEFFLSKNGKKIVYDTFSKTFLSLRKRCSWRNNSNPRIHDLRHTFAVKTLIRWYKEGKDVHQKIVYLSTYLGHVNITKTYWYLQAVPELLDIVSNRFQKFVSDTKGCQL